MVPPLERSTRRPLAAVALARVTQRLLRAHAPPGLHGEVARRMAARLPLIRMRPERVIDWGSFIGASHALLARAYPQARLVAVEPDAARRDATAAALAPPRWSPQRWFSGAPQALAADDVCAGQCDLLWANMSLHGVLDPPAVMRQWHQALRVDGFLMFSTLGPGTLAGLSQIYAACGWPPALAPFVDMHDLGDMLMAAGFADPVMDQEQITLTWPTPQAALAELRLLGGNVDPGRWPGLRTVRWREQLCTLLAASAGGAGRVALGFEVVYGHAFKAPPRPRAGHETAVPLDEMRAMARAGRRHV